MEAELRKLSQTELCQIREWLDDMIEDQLPFTPEFERSIQQAERDMADGKSVCVRVSLKADRIFPIPARRRPRRSPAPSWPSAIEQPAEVDVGEIIVRSCKKGHRDLVHFFA